MVDPDPALHKKQCSRPACRRADVLKCFCGEVQGVLLYAVNSEFTQLSLSPVYIDTKQRHAALNGIF